MLKPHAPAQRTAALCTAGLALVLSLSACGDDPASTGSGSPGAASADAQGPAEEPSGPAPSSPGAPSTPAAPSPSADPAAAAEPCGPADVSVTAGDIGAAAGTRQLTLQLTPVTGVDCPLSEVARLTLVAADGSAVPPSPQSAVGRLPDTRQPVDRLDGGFEGGVTTTFSWSVVPSGPDADPATDCLAASAVDLELVPGSEPIRVPVQLTACGAGALTAQPYDVNAG